MSGGSGGLATGVDPLPPGDASRGQGDIARFLDDVEASGSKPRLSSTTSLSASSGSRGCTPPPPTWERPGGSSRSDSPSKSSKSRSSGSRKQRDQKEAGSSQEPDTSSSSGSRKVRGSSKEEPDTSSSGSRKVRGSRKEAGSSQGVADTTSPNTSAEGRNLSTTSTEGRTPSNSSFTDTGLSSALSLQKLSQGPSPSLSSFGSHGPKSTNGKKKSWVSNALNPTYRSRCEDLRKNFPGLPQDEMLVVDYSCALQRDILVHGRLYVTTNFLCFYANIFRWETAVTIRWREVTELKKDKTALVIPNAVQVCTGADKFFFTSFATRDKSYLMLFRLWQNALLDSPASQTEIWSWVQAIYGEQTNRYNSDDPDFSADNGSNYSYDGTEQVHGNTARPRLCSNIQEDEEENKLAVNTGSFLPDKVGDQLMQSRLLKPVHAGEEGASDLSDCGGRASSLVSPSVVSTTTDLLTYEIWRQSKEAREIISRNFCLDIDDLFTLLFTNSKFFYDFQGERKTSDILQCPWQHSDQSEDKFREVSYTMALNHAIGPKTTRATEVQTMRSNSAPGHIYNVDVETTNADIPYADHFYVATHYCIVKVGEGESLLTVLCDIKYKKTPWGLVKSFIEKNCWAGIEEHYCALAASLDREVEARILEEGPAGEGKNKKLTSRRIRNQRRSSVGDGTVGALGAGSIGLLRPGNIRRTGVSEVPPPGPRESRLATLLVSLLVALVLLNLFLIYKVWSLEDRMGGGGLPRETGGRVYSQSGSWIEVLKEQETLHHRDLQAWRAAVESATRLLQQTERSMVRLAQSVDRDTNLKLLKTLVRLEEGHAQAVEVDSLEQEL